MLELLHKEIDELIKSISYLKTHPIENISDLKTHPIKNKKLWRAICSLDIDEAIEVLKEIKNLPENDEKIAYYLS